MKKRILTAVLSATVLLTGCGYIESVENPGFSASPKPEITDETEPTETEISTKSTTEQVTEASTEAVTEATSDIRSRQNYCPDPGPKLKPEYAVDDTTETAPDVEPPKTELVHDPKKEDEDFSKYAQEWSKNSNGDPIATAPQDKYTYACERLSALSYRSETCDGLPEYVLYAPDGTPYYLLIGCGHVWRNGCEADLPSDLADWLLTNQAEIGLYPTQWSPCFAEE